MNEGLWLVAVVALVVWKALCWLVGVFGVVCLVCGLFLLLVVFYGAVLVFLSGGAWLPNEYDIELLTFFKGSV